MSGGQGIKIIPQTFIKQTSKKQTPDAKAQIMQYKRTPGKVPPLSLPVNFRFTKVMAI